MGCVGLCAFFGAKTHVVWGREIREFREIKEGREIREVYKARETPANPPHPSTKATHHSAGCGREKPPPTPANPRKNRAE